MLGRGAGETMVRRLFTSYDRTDYRSCQYLYWVLIFTDWAQKQGHAQELEDNRKVKTRTLSVQTAERTRHPALNHAMLENRPIICYKTGEHFIQIQRNFQNGNQTRPSAEACADIAAP